MRIDAQIVLKRAGQCALDIVEDRLGPEPIRLSKPALVKANRVIEVHRRRAEWDQDIALGARPFILCGLRAPTGLTTKANAHVTNEAAYAQDMMSFWNGRIILGGGLRFDQFRYNEVDRVNPGDGGLQYGGRWQGKGSAAYTPAKSIPLTFTLNYGRGINSIDARGVVQRPDQPRLSTTDFYQFGASSNHGEFGLSADVFLIDHSNEQVYIPGSDELSGLGRVRTGSRPIQLQAPSSNTKFSRGSSRCRRFCNA